MADHLTSHQISCYAGRLLESDERRQFDRHIARCDACREQVAEAEDINGDVREFLAELEIEVLDEDDHLECEQIVAYVGGRLDEVDRIIADSHLEICLMCAREVREMQTFKEEFAPVSPFVEQHQFWTRVLTFWRELNTRHLNYAAGFAVVLILIAVAVLTFREPQESMREAQSARMTPVEQPLASLSPSAPATQPTRETPQPEDKTTGTLSSNSQPKPLPVEQRRNFSSLPKQPAPTTQTALVLNDNGKQVTLDQRGRISGLREASPELRNVMANALMAGRVGTMALEGIAGRPGVTLKGAGVDEEFEVLSPVGTIVTTDQPVFRWKPVIGATGYRVTVVKRGQAQIATSGTLATTEWYPPAGQLRPGVIYRWGVVATRADGTEVSAPVPTSPEARFKVLEPEQVARIKRLSALHARSPLTLGVLYAQEGLIDDAEREFEKLARQNPRSASARKLLESVRELRTGARTRRQ